MRALSIRQPWAWAILHAGKDVENRSWKSHFRGEFLIHAAKGCTTQEALDGFYFMDDRKLVPFWDDRWPGIDHVERGGIVGIARVIDCVSSSSSPWFVGPHGFVLADVRTIPFIPCRGALGFFEVPADIAARVNASLGRAA